MYWAWTSNLVLLCPTHHRAVHEVGYTVDALGQGLFVFHRPDGRLLPASGRETADPSSTLTDTQVTPDTIVPSWGGERLDLDLLIGGLASNALVRAGHHLADIPYPDLDPTLRAATQWPTPTTPPPRQVTAA